MVRCRWAVIMALQETNKQDAMASKRQSWDSTRGLSLADGVRRNPDKDGYPVHCKWGVRELVMYWGRRRKE